jgi:hypothetical protein
MCSTPCQHLCYKKDSTKIISTFSSLALECQIIFYLGYKQDSTKIISTFSSLALECQIIFLLGLQARLNKDY